MSMAFEPRVRTAVEAQAAAASPSSAYSVQRSVQSIASKHPFVQVGSANRGQTDNNGERSTYRSIGRRAEGMQRGASKTV